MNVGKTFVGRPMALPGNAPAPNRAVVDHDY